MLTSLTGQNLPNWIAAARDAALPGDPEPEQTPSGTR
jgi:hypothetical protein